MIVLKFGGTSVGTAESLANVKNIVENLEEDAIVVVSALGGLTDKLIATAKAAAAGDDSFAESWQAMADRHFHIIEDVIPDPCKAAATREAISPLLDELLRLYKGVSLISYLPDPTLDRIVSLGERMSSIIVANMIEKASHADSLKLIKTEKYFDKNIASTALTDSLIRDYFSEAKLPVVMGGFISSDKDTGEITNLGRGGSDYTAALVAAALDADVLQIWTDVDGFLTTDPRIVADARVIGEMSFVESMDLCTFGSKVIYPPTIYPVFHKNIPIRILNTHRPDAPGTLITDHPAARREKLAGISALKNESLISLVGTLALDSSAMASRCFNTLSKRGINAHVQTRGEQSEGGGVFSFALPSSDAETGVKLLQEEFAPELRDGSLSGISVRNELAILAVVGDNIKRSGTNAGVVLNILKNNGIESPAYSDKASETTLSFVIKEADVAKALTALHKELFGRSC